MHAQQQNAQIFRFDQSGSLLRKVMETAGVGMTLIGADGHVLYSNPAFESMLGYSADECLGMVGGEMVFPDDRAVIELHLNRLISGEAEEFRHEARMHHKDGSPLWVLASASLLRSEVTGRPLYGILQIINIDRQKRAEEALAASESRWNFALEAAGQGVWDHSIPDDGMFYSRMWRRMRGIPDGEYVDPSQENWLSRVHPDDVPRILGTVQKQDAGEDGYDMLEYRERHRDGHWIWILSRGRPVEFDANGNPLRTVGTDTDVTRFKTTALELAAEKERLRVTLQSIGDGVISTDAGERIVFMNPIAEQMTGWSETEALGRLVTDVFVIKLESTGEAAGDPVANCLKTGTPGEIGGETILASRDGIGRGVSGTVAPVRSGDGGVIGTVLVFKDVTENQELHRRLAYSANHDPLTGLPNRASFSRALAEACREAHVEQRNHVLCFIDLDRFKYVNDTAGHLAGDAVLQKVAQVIRRCCRNQDLAARLGGDEFVLLLGDCTLANAHTVAAKVVEAVGRLEFVWNESAYSIGASVGIAAITGEAGSDPLSDADAACYAAKSTGRGRVSVHEG